MITDRITSLEGCNSDDDFILLGMYLYFCCGSPPVLKPAVSVPLIRVEAEYIQIGAPRLADVMETKSNMSVTSKQIFIKVDPPI